MIEIRLQRCRARRRALRGLAVECAGLRPGRRRFLRRLAAALSRGSARAHPRTRAARLPGLPINDVGAAVRRQLGPLAHHAAGRAVPGARVALHLSRSDQPADLGGEGSRRRRTCIAIKHYSSTYEQTRTIWMDGRPHPGPNAPHTWMGFSTGRYDGDMLIVETTHLKQGGCAATACR